MNIFFIVGGMVFLSDVGVIGMILEDVYDLMGEMMDNPAYDKSCLMFGRGVLQYINYLCMEDGIELYADILNDDYFNYLMDNEKKLYFERLKSNENKR